MSVLLWLLIPLAGTLAALGWMSMRTKPRRPTTATAGMNERERMREAMERPLPGRRTAGNVSVPNQRHRAA